VALEILSSERRYGSVAQSIHWVSALLVIIAWTLGLFGEELPKGRPRELGELWHIFAGELILVLLLFRLVWRLVEPPPPAEHTAMGRFADLAAKLGHLALYALLLAVPAIGVATQFAGGEALSVFGLFEIASPWIKDRAFKHSLEEIHELTAHALIGLAALHALAALAHHFVFHDQTLRRMLPARFEP
jgi:cytochrome b561